MKEKIIELVLGLIPIAYGLYLYFKISQITKKSTEDELVEQDKKITSMKRSALLFTGAGAFLLFNFYQNL